MLTDKDIKKLSSVLATKKDWGHIVSRKEFSILQSDFTEFRSELKNFKHELFTTLEGIAKSIEDLKMEYVAIKVQLDRHDKWIKQLAEKTGISLKEL